MKLLKWLFILCAVLVLAFIALYIFGKTGPIASAYSERVLRQNISILNGLGFEVDTNSCRYIGPGRFLETHNPTFECVTTTSFNNSTAKEAVKLAAGRLQNAGWQGSRENFKYDPSKIQFFKGDLSIYIEPYYWQQGATESDYKFLIIFSRMTLWRPTWAM
jgi:hypothetical protein